MILPYGHQVLIGVLHFNNLFLGTVTIKHGKSTGFIADGGIANPAPPPPPPPPAQVLPASVLTEEGRGTDARNNQMVLRIGKVNSKGKLFFQNR